MRSDRRGDQSMTDGRGSGVQDPRGLFLNEVLGAGTKVAVVVIDMQHDFCSGDGALAQAGIDVSANERIVQPLGHFVDVLRSSGALIVWVKQLASPHHISPAIERRLRRAPERLQLCQQGTVGAELTDGLFVQAPDATVEKFRYSAFFGSGLDQVLRSSGTQTVVLVGTAANGCVDSTARDASQLDYDVVVVRDLTGHTDVGLADAALANLDRHFGLVCDSEDVVNRLP